MRYPSWSFSTPAAIVSMLTEGICPVHVALEAPAANSTMATSAPGGTNTQPKLVREHAHRGTRHTMHQFTPGCRQLARITRTARAESGANPNCARRAHQHGAG